MPINNIFGSSAKGQEQWFYNPGNGQLHWNALSFVQMGFRGWCGGNLEQSD
jgi:hypothetical protein